MLPALPSPAHRAVLEQKLSGFVSVIWDWTRIQDFTVERVNQVIAARGLQPEDLSPPRLDIAVPAIEAMRYSPLKHEMALLIVSTMDPQRANDAHPSFIEIIKQLTRDEVELLAAFPQPGDVLPMVNIAHVDRGGRVFSSMRHIIPARMAATCDARQNIPSYLDNLLRLSLIAAPTNLAISEDWPYRDLLDQAFIDEANARQPLHLSAQIERRVLGLTDFGDKFRRCCLGRPAALA